MYHKTDKMLINVHYKYSVHCKSIKVLLHRKMSKDLSEDNSQKKYKWLINIRKIFSLIKRNAYLNEILTYLSSQQKKFNYNTQCC